MQAYTEKMGTYILTEKDMNDRKRLFNREVGRKAIVNEVSTVHRSLSNQTIIR